jgi:hypothetical protein
MIGLAQVTDKLQARPRDKGLERRGHGAPLGVRTVRSRRERTPTKRITCGSGCTSQPMPARSAQLTMPLRSVIRVDCTRS